MHAIHDRFTDEMCNRLKTTCMGLGLVRLLQDARRFDEAKLTLALLEQSDKPGPRKTNRLKGVTTTAATKIGAAETLHQPMSVA